MISCGLLRDIRLRLTYQAVASADRHMSTVASQKTRPILLTNRRSARLRQAHVRLQAAVGLQPRSALPYAIDAARAHQQCRVVTPGATRSLSETDNAGVKAVTALHLRMR